MGGCGTSGSVTACVTPSYLLIGPTGGGGDQSHSQHSSKDRLYEEKRTLLLRLDEFGGPNQTCCLHAAEVLRQDSECPPPVAGGGHSESLKTQHL